MGWLKADRRQPTANMWHVIGQDNVICSLERSIAQGRLSHAYLLVGPKHVGKMTLALNLVQSLNCTAGEKPCGECSTCRRIMSGNYPDLAIIELMESSEDQSSRKSIGVDQIREMQHSISLNPYEGACRVIIIDGAEYMSESAGNALLKTLEEPPGSTFIILLAVEESRLLDTIRSRCQRLELNRMPVQSIQLALTDREGMSSVKADMLARFSHGCIGWAISAMRDESILEERHASLEKLIALTCGDISERFRFAADLASDFSRSRVTVRERLELWLVWWRDLMLWKTGREDFIVNIDRRNLLRDHAAQCDLGSIARAIRSIHETIHRLDLNANPRLALEVLMLDIPILEKEASYA